MPKFLNSELKLLLYLNILFFILAQKFMACFFKTSSQISSVTCPWLEILLASASALLLTLEFLLQTMLLLKKTFAAL